MNPFGQIALSEGPPQYVGWTPASLGGVPKIWLNDSSAVTDAGAGACSQWNDVSGNANHFVQGTGAARPLIQLLALNNRRTIKFNGTSHFMELTSNLAVFQNVTSASIGVVWKKNPTGVSAADRWIFHAPTNVNGNSRFTLLAGSTTDGDLPQARLRRLDADTAATLNMNNASDGNYHLTLFTMDYTNRPGTFYQDGATDNSNATLTTAGSTSNTASQTRIAIGAHADATKWGGIEIAELFILTGYIPTGGERDKIAGYFAWMWGLQSLLPGGHPYKSVAPT